MITTDLQNNQLRKGFTMNRKFTLIELLVKIHIITKNRQFFPNGSRGRVIRHWRAKSAAKS